MKAEKIKFNIYQLTILSILVALAFTGGIITTFKISDIEGNKIYKPKIKPDVKNKINLSCPKPKDFQQKVEVKYGKGNFNYIQAPYTPLKFDFNGEKISIPIDKYARPEGSSMRPTIFSGNTLLLQKYKGQDLEAGQIIRFKSSSGHLIHRIEADYSDTSGLYLTRGDNRARSEKVKPGQITHVVAGVLYTPEKKENSQVSLK